MQHCHCRGYLCNVSASPKTRLMSSKCINTVPVHVSTLDTMDVSCCEGLTRRETCEAVMSVKMADCNDYVEHRKNHGNLE